MNEPAYKYRWRFGLSFGTGELLVDSFSSEDIVEALLDGIGPHLALYTPGMCLLTSSDISDVLHRYSCWILLRALKTGNTKFSNLISHWSEVEDRLLGAGMCHQTELDLQAVLRPHLSESGVVEYVNKAHSQRLMSMIFALPQFKKYKSKIDNSSRRI